MYTYWPFLAPLLLMCFTPSSQIFHLGATNNASPCGTIPYPFGLPGTALSGFEVACINNSHKSPLLLPHQTSNNTNISFSVLETKNGRYVIQNISLQGQVRIYNGPIYRQCYNSTNGNVSGTALQGWLNLEGTPFTISKNHTTLVSIGCDDVVMIQDMKGADMQKRPSLKSGCVSFCSDLRNVIDGSCSGLGCCQAALPIGLKSFDLQLIRILNTTMADQLSNCTSAFFATLEEFSFKSASLQNQYQDNGANYVVVLDWAIGNQTCSEAFKDPKSYACKNNSNCYDSPTGVGYLCNCTQGYQGNPYVGCEDTNECLNPESNPCVYIEHCINKPGTVKCTCPAGHSGDGKKNGNGCKKKAFPMNITLGTCLALVFLLFMVTLYFYWFLQKRKLNKMRSEYFIQNGGWILRQRLASEGVDSTSRIFSIEELQKATDNYNEDRILGRGGYGTVYKGILSDRRVVAIKRSRLVDDTQVEQFINEITILSQVNHRNVVKLLGCCLETEVPLLVYEFISNGTLFEHIHNRGPLSWEDRLRISTEIACAIAYLHSAAAFPIIHRDIKSSNILLDEKFTAKVSDFGASRSVPFDQTHITTLVQGTLGYLDPEYFHTSQLTEKSDVYSFGVILAELLTGKKPISFDRSEDSCNLATYFATMLDEGRLVHLLEPHVLEEARLDETHIVANIAKRCLNVKGEERPNMKEVAFELEGLRRLGKKNTSQENLEDNEEREEQNPIKAMGVESKS